MKLQHKIDLQAVGKNSRLDDGGALIIKGVVCLTPGDFISDVGRQVSINSEAIKLSNWDELIVGRPIIEGHTDIDGNNTDITLGSIKSVRLDGDKVVCDLIIQDNKLKSKIMAEDLRSVSLSFTYDGERIDYINHLGVVKLGQVPDAVINLEKKTKGETMENQEIERLKKEKNLVF